MEYLISTLYHLTLFIKSIYTRGESFLQSHKNIQVLLKEKKKNATKQK